MKKEEEEEEEEENRLLMTIQLEMKKKKVMKNYPWMVVMILELYLKQSKNCLKVLKYNH